MANITGIGGKRKTVLPPFGDDRELVSRLIEMDAAAWEFVIGERIFPALARSANLSRDGVAFARPGSSPVPGAPFLEVTSP